MLNGVRLEKFTPRGIRQGDPISPYLFVPVVKIKMSVISSQGYYGGYIGSDGQSPSFTDDSLLFFKSNMENAQEVRDVLRSYCRASGQEVNMDKS